MSAELWHYTCTTGRLGIELDGLLEPAPRRDPLPLVWLTDLPRPHRLALGLTSITLSCDRTEHRYRVTDTADVVPWFRWRRAHPEVRAFADLIESDPGVMPAHWFVSEVPVPVELDPLDRDHRSTPGADWPR